jgi:hypothetical protein
MTEQNPIETTKVAVVTPKGKAAWLERHRASNPDISEDLSDDALFDYSHSAYSELEGKHNVLEGANKKIAEKIEQNPDLLEFLSLILDGSSPQYAWGKSFGAFPLEFDENGSKEYERGFEERKALLQQSKAEIASANKNFTEFLEKTLPQYVKDTQKTPDQAKELYEKVMEIGEAYITGAISLPILEIIDKGLEFDTALEEATEAAERKGKNDNIIKMRVKQNAFMPNLSSQPASRIPKGAIEVSKPQSSLLEQLREKV